MKLMTPIRIQFAAGYQLIAEVIVHQFDVDRICARFLSRKPCCAVSQNASMPRLWKVPVGSNFKPKVEDEQ